MNRKEINMDRPIGIFDSGVGGLTVLSLMQKQLPFENLIYIGDNAHCPYGDKSKEELLIYTKEICDYFISQNVKMIVLACNTTSANVLEDLQNLYPNVAIVGVISSTVHDLLSQHPQRVLIIATHATIHSHKYKETIKQYDATIKTYELETPLLVPFIESGEYKKGIHQIIQNYLSPYQDCVDTLILGCTHYPIILNQIKEVFKDKTYVSSSEAICQEVDSYLKVHHLFNQNKKRYVRIYTTGDVDEFVYSSSGFYDYQDNQVCHLDL